MPTAVLYQCQVALQATIRGLSLSGIANDNVITQEVLDDKNKDTSTGTLPSILIAPLPETLRDGTNDRDDVGYNFAIALCAAGNQGNESQLSSTGASVFGWRESIRRKFHNQRLSGVAENYVCTIVPEQPIHAGAWASNLFLSLLRITCWCREPRAQRDVIGR